MNNFKRANKKFLVTLALAVVIVALAGVAFLPTVFSKRETTQAATAGSEVDAEAMRVFGCCNAYVAANAFRTNMTGTVKARVVGVPYTQIVHSERTVDSASGKYTDIAESTSALVKTAVKRERRDGVFYVSHGSYKNRTFSYGDEQELSKTNYIAQYGQPFTGVVKYNMENSVICAEKTDDNCYRYVLDPAHSTVYSRNEVKTTLHAKSHPEYKSVEFTLMTDGNRPVKVTCTEKFRIDKFGGTDCTAEYNETFYFD